MIDELMKKNDELKKSFKKKPVEDIVEICAGCDCKTLDSGQWTNGKNYCPRCYEEVKSLYDRKG